MLSLIDLLNTKKSLSEITTNLLIGRTVKIKGCVESGEFDVLKKIDEIEYIKKITGSGKFTITSIHDIKIGPSSNGHLLDFSCISEMSIARCSNQDCRSEVDMEEKEDGVWCSRCGNIVSDWGDWTVYKIESSSSKVRLLRV